ncbi:hypothetical protein V6N12_049453 [Hibiscus sabdariffa]|uniref:Phosphoribosylformylglycinamidine synthase n=2 Tax=Hibiscus sabdariffa TaxID=183260 RepID=A0ABR2CBD5_9ROSI
MACRMVLRSLSVTEAWRPLRRSWDFLSFRSFTAAKRGGAGIHGMPVVRARDVHFWNGIPTLNCSQNGAPSSKSEEDQLDQAPPQEAVLKAISEVSKKEGRIGQTTNVVIGGTVADDSTNEWLALDQKVNSYPTVRGFIAIGTGGDDFVQAMIVAVESVLQQPIPEGRVRQKVSSRGKYVSVNIGPVQVVSSEQVQAVYNAMRRDNRMKYFL